MIPYDKAMEAIFKAHKEMMDNLSKNSVSPSFPINDCNQSETIHGATCIQCKTRNEYVEIKRGSKYTCYSCKSYSEM